MAMLGLCHFVDISASGHHICMSHEQACFICVLSNPFGKLSFKMECMYMNVCVVCYVHTATILWPPYRATCISQHRSYELEDFIGAKFYCPHAVADGN